MRFIDFTRQSNQQSAAQTHNLRSFRLVVFFLSCLLAGFSIRNVLAQDAQNVVFLPAVVQEATPTVTPNTTIPPTFTPTAQPTQPAQTLPPQTQPTQNDQESQAETLFLREPGQQHPTLHWNETLAAVARAKAQDMANRNYFAHVDPDGYGPNYFASQAGYRLPNYYPKGNDANNIESIGAGYADAQAVWEAWMQSPAHRMHLLGEHEFYRSQIDYGIGYVYMPNSYYQHYWVILIAEPGN